MIDYSKELDQYYIADGCSQEGRSWFANWRSDSKKTLIRIIMGIDHDDWLLREYTWNHTIRNCPK